MSKAKDVEILLFKRLKEFTNRETQEKFTNEVLDGYVTYKGSPVQKVTGNRVEDKTFTVKATGKPFTVSKFRVKFMNGEDFKDEDLKEEGSLSLKIEERTNKEKTSKFYTLSSDDHYFGKDDPRNTKGFRIGNMVLPLSGIIEPNTSVDQFGGDVIKIKLTASNKLSVGRMTNDAMADDDVKVGYTASTPDELYTDEELEGLAKQFPYFARFKQAFDGVKKDDTVKEKVKPSAF
jgi:hypothetical protein